MLRQAMIAAVCSAALVSPAVRAADEREEKVWVLDIEATKNANKNNPLGEISIKFNGFRFDVTLDGLVEAGLSYELTIPKQGRCILYTVNAEGVRIDATVCSTSVDPANQNRLLTNNKDMSIDFSANKNTATVPSNKVNLVYTRIIRKLKKVDFAAIKTISAEANPAAMGRHLNQYDWSDLDPKLLSRISSDVQEAKRICERAQVIGARDAYVEANALLRRLAPIEKHATVTKEAEAKAAKE